MEDTGTYTVCVSNRAGAANASFDINFKGICMCLCKLEQKLPFKLQTNYLEFFFFFFFFL